MWVNPSKLSIQMLCFSWEMIWRISLIISTSMRSKAWVMNRGGVDVMTTKELFDFVTSISIKEEDYDRDIAEVCFLESWFLIV